jgi:type IV pilus assembly protein PilV
MQLKSNVQGFALIEALVALLILAFGMLGLRWTHQQALVSQRQQLMRSVAAGIANDLTERIRLNAPQRESYAKGWGSSSTSLGADCAASPCLRSDLVSWDLSQLQKTLQSQLPEGDVAIFALTTAPQWWGIVIAWRDTQESYRTDTRAGTPPCPTEMSCWQLLFRPDR